MKYCALVTTTSMMVLAGLTGCAMTNRFVASGWSSKFNPLSPSAPSVHTTHVLALKSGKPCEIGVVGCVMRLAEADDIGQALADGYSYYYLIDPNTNKVEPHNGAAEQAEYRAESEKRAAAEQKVAEMQAKQRQAQAAYKKRYTAAISEGIAKMKREGYQTESIQDLILDGNTLAQSDTKVAIVNANMFKVGNKHMLLPEGGAGMEEMTTGNLAISIGVITDDASRATRKALLECDSNPSSQYFGCGLGSTSSKTTYLGRASTCTASSLFGTKVEPCLILEHAWTVLKGGDGTPRLNWE